MSALALLVGLGAPLTAHAQEPAAPSPSPVQPTPLEPWFTPAPAPLEPTPAPTPTPTSTPALGPEKPNGAHVTAAPGRGFTITSEANDYSLTLRGRIQIRETLSHDQKSDSTELAVKTVRLVASGHVVVPELRYNIQLALGAGDFEKDNPSPVYDAYVEYAKIRDLNLRLGQYFVPFDRARTTREYALQLVDRQQVVRELSLDRDVGLMLSSSDLFGADKVLAYNLFVGSGKGKNRVGLQKPGVLGVARFTLRPWGAFDDDQEGDLSREPRPRLAIGIAGGYNHQASRAQSTLGTIDTLGVFDFSHAAADVVFKYAGFSLLTEGLYRHANHDHFDTIVSGAPVHEFTRSGYGYFVQSGMMLTRHFEVAGRWEDLWADNATQTDPALVSLVGNTGRQAGGGLNLYLNGHLFKIQTDYFYVFGRHTAGDAHVARLQVDASF